MAFHMRKSKFRHVFGQGLRKDQCYDNIRITKSSLDSTFCSVNPKSVAIITEAAGGGAFLVIPLSKTGRIERDHPMVAGHKGAVMDVQWCPHNDDVIASGSEDCTVKVWQIPDEGLLTNLTECVVSLEGHQRRVHLVQWHPTAQNILLSAGADDKTILWNVGTGEAYVEIDLPQICLSASFNYDGSRVAMTCKDRMLHVYNARNGEQISVSKCHEGSKPSQCMYLKHGKIFTTGFSRMSERQYALWDENNMSESMHMDVIDSSNGVIFPFYDADSNMVYLCGKGDSIIRYYEITDEAPYIHYLALFQSKEAQRGIGMMCKRGLDVNHCEITRFYKLLNTGLCEVIPFTVPRKSELFQDDLYPDTAGDIPAVTAEEFMEGKKDSNPILVSLKAGFKSDKKEKLVVKKGNILDTPAKTPAKPPPAAAASQQSSDTSVAAGSAPSTTPPPIVPALPANFDPEAVLKDIAELKTIIKSQEKKIAALERRFAEFEGNVDDLVNENEEKA